MFYNIKCFFHTFVYEKNIYYRSEKGVVHLCNLNLKV